MTGGAEPVFAEMDPGSVNFLIFPLIRNGDFRKVGQKVAQNEHFYYYSPDTLYDFLLHEISDSECNVNM